MVERICGRLYYSFGWGNHRGNTMDKLEETKWEELERLAEELMQEEAQKKEKVEE